MPKIMNMKSMYFSKLNLQLFAEDDSTGEDAGDGDDQDEESEDDTDEGGDDEPKFTQADIDKAVARTIAKERAKAERAERRKKQKEKEGSENNDENEEVKARKIAEARADSLEVRCACFEAGVAKESVKDVTALAKAYMEEDDKLDLEDAIEEVLKKYPQFKKGTADPYEEEEETRGKKWGQRQNGRTSKMSGVEKRFYELNPDLKK